MDGSVFVVVACPEDRCRSPLLDQWPVCWHATRERAQAHAREAEAFAREARREMHLDPVEHGFRQSPRSPFDPTFDASSGRLTSYVVVEVVSRRRLDWATVPA